MEALGVLVSMVFFGIGIAMFAVYGSNHERRGTLVAGAVLTAWGFFILGKVL